MTMTSGPGILSRLWYQWKSIKLPWRRQFLIGADLAGNTFWEFKDQLNANRLRRIVRYNRKAHYADIKISPQWHQWLRHTRDEAPSLQEQRHDLIRQEQLKRLAAQADERWASKASYLDAPQKQQPQPAIGVSDTGGYVGQTERAEVEGVRSAVGSHDEVEASSKGIRKNEGRFKGSARERPSRDEVASPFQQPQRGAPGEGWQPQSWTPSPRR